MEVSQALPGALLGVGIRAVNRFNLRSEAGSRNEKGLAPEQTLEGTFVTFDVVPTHAVRRTTEELVGRR